MLDLLPVDEITSSIVSSQENDDGGNFMIKYFYISLNLNNTYRNMVRINL